MRNYFVFMLLCCLSSGVIAQSIPNSTFEKWTSGKPDNWDASNEKILGTAFTTVTQETASPYGGKGISVCMTTVYKNILFQDVTLPGIITLGDFQIVDFEGSITGGIPFPYKPLKLKGYYKSSPSKNDSGVVAVGLAKWRTGLGRDTIATGIKHFSKKVTVWTAFEVPITWKTTETPDSLNIIISSSDVINGSYVTGSKFWVDELSFEYDLNTGAIEIPVSQSNIIQLYPNPAKSHVNIFASDLKEVSVRNLLGQEVLSIRNTSVDNQVTLDISRLLSGNYFIRVTSGNKLYTQKLVVY